MSELKYEVKTSKLIIIIFGIACFIFEAFFASVSIFGIVSLAREEYKSSYNPSMQLSMEIFVLSFCLILFFVFVFINVYFIKDAIKQVDVYTADKFYRKKGDKIIYEIKYSNIKNVKVGLLNCLLLFCKEGFVKNGTNMKYVIRPQMTFMEYYSSKDINKIIQIITDYQSNSEQCKE